MIAIAPVLMMSVAAIAPGAVTALQRQQRRICLQEQAARNTQRAATSPSPRFDGNRPVLGGRSGFCGARGGAHITTLEQPKQRQEATSTAFHLLSPEARHMFEV
jgi:hypothetical protein